MATWHNHNGNQSSQIAGLRKPKSVDEISELVREAEAAGIASLTARLRPLLIGNR